jgi:hypothetical protein
MIKPVLPVPVLLFLSEKLRVKQQKIHLRVKNKVYKEERSWHGA